MSIQRIATPAVVAQRLIELLAERVSMNVEDVLPTLRAEGLRLPEDEKLLLDDLLDAEVGLDIMEVDDLLIHQPALFDNRVFTHRVTADDLSGEMFEIHEDLAPLMWWLADEVLVTTSTELWSTGNSRDPEVADSTTRHDHATATTRHDHTATPSTAPHNRSADSHDYASTSSRPAEIVRVGGGSAAMILPEPTLTDMGLTPGDLVAITVHGRTMHLCPTTPAAAEPELLEALSDLVDERPQLTELPDFCLRFLAQQPESFTSPVAPLSELLTAAGVTSRLRSTTHFLAAATDATQADDEEFIRSLSDLYSISTTHATIVFQIADAVRALQIAVSHVASLAAKELAERLESCDADPNGPDLLDRRDPLDVPDLSDLDAEALMPELPGSLAEQISDLLDAVDPIAADWPKFVTDSWLVHALAEECVRHAQSPQALGLVLERMPAVTDRAGRANRAYLDGRISEAVGHPLAAATHYRHSAELTDNPSALAQLAGIEFDKGNLAAAASLLDRSGAGDDYPLRSFLAKELAGAGRSGAGASDAGAGAGSADSGAGAGREPQAPARKPGRNAPCWCGSGRKYKVCHGRPGGGEKSLIDRARLLNDKMVWWLLDNHPHRVQELFNTADDVAGRAIPEDVFGHVIFDTLLIEDGLIADYLAMRGKLLPPDEAMLVAQWQFSERSVFDIESVDRGEALHLRDLRTGTRMVVPERRGSEVVDAGEYICTRVVDVDGRPMIFGGIELVALNQRDGLIALLDSEPSAVEVVRRLAGRYAPPMMLNPDGEPLVIVAGTFAVAFLDELVEWLDGRDDMLAEWERRGDGADAGGTDGEPERTSWDWIEPVVGGLEGEVRPLATLTLIDGLLGVTALSEQRYEKLVAILESSGIPMIEREVTRTGASEILAQRAASHEADAGVPGQVAATSGGRGIGLTSGAVTSGGGPGAGPGGALSGGPGSALGGGRGAGPGGAMGGGFISADEALENPELAAIIGAKVAQYEREWLDEPIPALQGFTPREAAADPTRRDDLIRLLETFPSDGQPHVMDGGRLRAALGL